MHFKNGLTDRNAERYMIPHRVGELCRCLKDELMTIAVVPLSGMEIREEDGPWRPFDAVNERWGAASRHFFFRQTVVIPPEMEGCHVRFAATPGPHGGWDWATPQILAWVDGEIRQGMDSNHRYFVLSACAKAGETHEILLDAYCDRFHFQEPLQMRTSLVCVDREAEKLYYDMHTALLTAGELPVDDVNRIDLLRHLNAACNLLDLRTGRCERATESVRAAQKYVDETIYAQPREANEVTVNASGHTHIDVAWKWTYGESRDKTARSFSTVLSMMDDYPLYRFMSSQPQLYAFIQEDHPELFERIRKKVQEGRWEVEGGMWVEADTNLPSGESLVRQFLYGTRYFEKEFGKKSKVLWLPDVFGYSAALPQIMKKSGVDYFMTTKISWNEYNKLPYDTFRWRGIDGSEVLSHFICAQNREVVEQGEFVTAYNAWMDPSTVMGGWLRYQQKDLNRQILMNYGHGDGGGGPEPYMQELGERMARGIPGCPRVQFGPVQRFFEKLEEDVKDNKRLPLWQGELYFEYHRGTYTSMGIIKKLNRQLEYLLQSLEIASVLSDMVTGGSDYPAALLQECWRTVLLNQFHDVLPGSSIKEVYDEVILLQQGVMEKAEAALQAALERIEAALPAKAEGQLVFNPLSFPRRDLLLADIPQDVTAVKTESGEVFPVQHTAQGALCMAEAPAKGCGRLYYVRDAAPAASCCSRADTSCMENSFFLLAFDGHMNIVSLWDKRLQRELVPEGQPMNRLIVYEDRPMYDQAWNIQPYYQEHAWEADDVTSACIEEDGPVRTVLALERRFLSSVIRQRIILYRDIPRIDVENDIDWQEHDLLLKADFPTCVHSSLATFDIQFGNLQRTTHTNTLWDFAQFETCAHKWVDLSQDDFGLSVLSDCKYGWDVKDGHIRLTMLKSSCYPNPEADKGRHRFSYSLYPHAGGWREGLTDQEGFRFNVPLRAVAGSAHPGEEKAAALLSVDLPNVVVETVKQAEDGDGLIVRLYECMNRTSDFNLTLHFPASSAQLCNLLEQPEAEAAVEDGCIRGCIKPYEILTYRIRS